MAPHSSTLAWKIPWTEVPGRLQPMGSLSQTYLSDFTFTFHFHALEKEMATHCSVLAWRIPGTGEPGGLPPIGSHRVGRDWSNLAAAATELTTKPIFFSQFIYFLDKKFLSVCIIFLFCIISLFCILLLKPTKFRCFLLLFDFPALVALSFDQNF